MTHTPSPPTQPNGIPIRDAAAQIPCCARTLRKEIAQGRLPAFRLGPRIFIKPEDFENYMQNIEWFSGGPQAPPGLTAVPPEVHGVGRTV